jgi:hypothetical protein
LQFKTIYNYLYYNIQTIMALSITNTLPLPAPENKSNATRTFVVGDGSPYQTITAAITAINAAIALAPGGHYVIELRPGVYDETFTLPPYTDLHGSCTTGCFIQPTGQTNVVIALPITSITENCISNITISASNNAAFHAIWRPSTANIGTIYIRHCNIMYSSMTALAVDTFGSLIEVNRNTTCIIEDCKLTISTMEGVGYLGTYTGINAAGGVALTPGNADVTIRRSQISIEATGADIGLGAIMGIRTTDSAKLTVQNCLIKTSGAVTHTTVAGIYNTTSAEQSLGYTISGTTFIGRGSVKAAGYYYGVYYASTALAPGALRISTCCFSAVIGTGNGTLIWTNVANADNIITGCSLDITAAINALLTDNDLGAGTIQCFMSGTSRYPTGALHTACFLTIDGSETETADGATLSLTVVDGLVTERP